MLPRARYAEYLAEIRERVCARCPQRSPDGPPYHRACRSCGIELQLPSIVESVRDTGDELSEFDEAPDRGKVCAQCHCLGGGYCPCAAAPLAALLVRAVIAVDERREQRECVRRVVARQARLGRCSASEVMRTYEAATGTCLGCD